ncbi:hypothetical protein DL771_010200 [Monosporascus sp. 5C6A]|nr:hypothetical protein DL771_010200 [Monosporascus sp. 5C6A]
MKRYDEIEFKTVDGLTIRGWLYPASGRGPGVIMTPGFNFTKEMFVPDIAEYYQDAGFTVLSYDPRSIGQSDGMPRNEIHPSRNAEDYHDALTFLKGHPLVDPSRIVYWGFSFSGMVALTAAALDKRAKAVVATCPLTIWDLPEDKWPRVLAKAMKDRESRVAGNPAVKIPMLTENGENPAGFGSGFDVEGFTMIAGVKSVEPNFELPTSLSSYYHIAAFQPFGLMRYVSPTPVMIVTPENDQLSPAEKQKKLIYDEFTGPKRFLLVPGKGHMNVLSGDGLKNVLDAQIEFIRSVVGE